MRKSAKSGFSLMEIMVSSVLVSLTALGLLNLFVTGKKYLAHSRARMTGGEIGKLFVDRLQNDVRQNNWGDAAVNSLALTAPARFCDGSGINQQPNCPAPADRVLGGITYSAEYNITNVTNNPEPNLRRGQIIIRWNEPNPRP